MDKRIIALIISCYVVFFVAIPPFQIPDEPEHYQYIYWLTRFKYPYLVFKAGTPAYTKLLLTMQDVYDTVEVVSQDFTLPPFARIQKTVQSRTMVKNNDSSFPKPLSYQAHHPPLYHIAGALLFGVTEILKSDIITQYYIVKLTSTLFYVLSVWAAYRLLKLLFRSQKTVSSLLVVFAINPITLKMGVGINPDIAVTFFALLYLWLALLYVKTGLSYKRTVLLSVVGSLCALTKFQGVFVHLFFLIFLIRYHMPTVKKMRHFFLYSAISLLFLTPWFGLNYLRYGAILVDNFAVVCTKNLPRYPLVEIPFQALFEFRHTINHFAGFLGWGEPYPFKVFFYGYTIISSVLFIAGIYSLRRAPDKRMTLAICFFFSLVAFLYAVSLRHKINQYSCDIQGRYLLPVFLPYILIAARGLVYLARAKEDAVSRALMLFSLFQFFLILFYVLIPKYYI